MFVFFHDFSEKPNILLPTFIAGYVRLQVTYAWTAFEGCLIAIAFFYNSGEARARWRRWFKLKMGGSSDDDRQNFEPDGADGTEGSRSDSESVRQGSSWASSNHTLPDLQEDYVDDMELERCLEEENVAYQRQSERESKNRISRMSELTVQSSGAVGSGSGSNGSNRSFSIEGIRVSGANPSLSSSGRCPSLPALDNGDDIA